MQYPYNPKFHREISCCQSFSLLQFIPCDPGAVRINATDKEMYSVEMKIQKSLIETTKGETRIIRPELEKIQLKMNVNLPGKRVIFELC